MGRGRRLTIVLASGNPHKLNELKRLLAIPGIRWRLLAEFPGVQSVKERGGTFDANAVSKARAAARATACVALADDSGLEVSILGGAPGVRSARFAGRHGDDQANTGRLLRLLDGVPASLRSARYRCSLALAQPSGRVAVARGVWRGRIAVRAAGRGGFGYDPVFFLPRFGKTVAQLPAAVKQRLSHRARAARRMRGPIHRLLRRKGP